MHTAETIAAGMTVEICGESDAYATLPAHIEIHGITYAGYEGPESGPGMYLDRYRLNNNGQEEWSEWRPVAMRGGRVLDPVVAGRLRPLRGDFTEKAGALMWAAARLACSRITEEQAEAGRMKSAATVRKYTEELIEEAHADLRKLDELIASGAPINAVKHGSRAWRYARR